MVEELGWPEENNWISFALVLPDAEFGEQTAPIPVEEPDEDEYGPSPLTIVFISCRERPRTIARIADATLDDVHTFVIDRNERLLFLLLRTSSVFIAFPCPLQGRMPHPNTDIFKGLLFRQHCE